MPFSSLTLQGAEHNVRAVKQDAPESGRTTFPRAAFAVAVCAVLAVLGTFAGHRFATAAVIDIGPADGAYVEAFRDLERDGDSYFRWSTVPTSTVKLPVRFCGPGLVQMRVRRHFADAALLTVSVNGTVVGSHTVQAREDKPYDVLSFPVSKVVCGPKSSVTLESQVSNGRPLGVAVDWLAIQSPAGFDPARDTLLRASLVGGLIAAACMLVGTSWGGTIAGGVGLAAILMALFASQPVAAQRMLWAGLPALVITLGVGAILSGVFGLGALNRRYRMALLALILGALAARIAFLHPLVFYPDYRVHALVGETLSRGGLSSFLSNLFTIQYARSLGLQQIEGRWYPFPYPPGSYVLIQAVSSAFGLRMLEASLATAAAAGALLPLLGVALARAVGLEAEAGVRAAGFLVIHPLLIRRMALGYFPGVIGQFLDALALVFLVRALAETKARARGILALSCCLLAGFLVYTQSIANFGILLAMLLGVEAIRRTPQARTAVLAGLAASAALAMSVWLFYSIYVPVARNVSAHRAQPEASTLERLERSRASAFPIEGLLTDDDEVDPFAGTAFDPARGGARLASRLWRFQGAFALLLVPGLWLLWSEVGRSQQNLLVAWLSIPIWINLLAAGLPSPNGFQHLKDLEFATPLFALAFGAVFDGLGRIQRAASWAMGLAWAAYAASVAVAEFAARLLPLLER